MLRILKQTNSLDARIAVESPLRTPLLFLTVLAFFLFFTVNICYAANVWNDSLNTVGVGYNADLNWTVIGGAVVSSPDAYISAPVSMRGNGNGGYWMYRFSNYSNNTIYVPVDINLYMYRNGSSSVSNIYFQVSRYNVGTYCDTTNCLQIGLDTTNTNLKIICPAASTAGNAVADNSWVRLTLKIRNTSTEIYMNDTLQYNCTGVNNINYSSFKTVQFGKESVGLPNQVYFDNITVSTVEDATPSQASAIFRPLTRKYMNILNLTTNLSFYSSINYTIGGVENASQSCNLTLYNASAKFRNDNSSNVTIGAGSSYSLHINEGNTSIISDRVKVFLCKNGIGTIANIYVNSTLLKSVPAATMPLCSSGYHEENFYTNGTKGYIDFWLNVSCSSCTGSNTLKIVSDTYYNESIKFFREFSSHKEAMVYNSSSKVFDYLNYLYQFETKGSNFANASCIGYSEQTNFSVLSGNISIRILSLNDATFTNGSVLEDSNHTSILFGAYGDVISTVQLNLTNSSGLLAQSTTEELINYYFPMNGMYNLSGYALSVNGQSAYVKGYFFVNDTTMPQIFWTFPKQDNTSTATYETYQQISVSYVDTNLYAYNITVLDPIGQIVKFYEEKGLMNVSGKTYTTNMYMNGTGNWTVIAEAVDSHTSSNIKGYKVTEDKNSGRIDFETDIDLTGAGDYSNVTIKYNGGTLPLKNVKTTKQDDRYNFEYEFITTGSKPGDKMSGIYRVECKGLDRIETRWKGHIICWDSRTWIDFADVGNSLTLKKETRCGKDCYEFTFDSDVKDKISFNSFGELNHVSETATFEVLTSAPVNYTLRWLECPTDEGNLKQLIWMYAVFLAILVAGYIGKSGLLCIFSMFGMIGLGFVYVACFEIIGMSSIMFGFFTGIYGIYLITVKNKW